MTNQTRKHRYTASQSSFGALWSSLDALHSFNTSFRTRQGNGEGWNKTNEGLYRVKFSCQYIIVNALRLWRLLDGGRCEAVGFFCTSSILATASLFGSRLDWCLYRIVELYALFHSRLWDDKALGARRCGQHDVCVGCLGFKCTTLSVYSSRKGGTASTVVVSLFWGHFWDGLGSVG